MTQSFFRPAFVRWECHGLGLVVRSALLIALVITVAGRSVSLAATCGDGVLDPGEECDLGAINGQYGNCCAVTCIFVNPSVECRAPTADCDQPEHCTGTDANCPPDENACTPSPTPSFTPTPTLTGTATQTGTVTQTASLTPTVTSTGTVTLTPSNTPTLTVTPTATVTPTPPQCCQLDSYCRGAQTPGVCPGEGQLVINALCDGNTGACISPTPSLTLAPTPTRTATSTATATGTITATATATFTLPTGVDPYKCYRIRASAKFQQKTVTLVDQFDEDQKTVVLKPYMLCNPSEKQDKDGLKGTPPLNPETHLVCYKIRKAKGEPKSERHTVNTRNEIVPEVINTEKFTVIKPNFLCIPSEKMEVLPTATATSARSATPTSAPPTVTVTAPPAATNTPT